MIKFLRSLFHRQEPAETLALEEESTLEPFDVETHALAPVEPVPEGPKCKPDLDLPTEKQATEGLRRHSSEAWMFDSRADLWRATNHVPSPLGPVPPSVLMVQAAAEAQISALENERDALEIALRRARAMTPGAGSYSKLDLESAIHAHTQELTSQQAAMQREINELRNWVDQAHIELDRARIPRKVRSPRQQKGVKVSRMLFLYERINRLRKKAKH